MKKLLCLIALAVIVMPLSAKGPKADAAYELQKQFPNEIGIDCGFPSFENYVSMYVGTITLAFTSAAYDYSSFNIYPSIGVSYKRNLSRTFAVGASVHYAGSTSKWVDKNDATQHGKFDLHFLMLSAECNITYVRADWFTFYGVLGAGVSGCFGGTSYDASGEKADHSVSVLPNAQISPLGFRFGRRFGGHIELGFGYKGIVNAGLDYRF